MTFHGFLIRDCTSTDATIYPAVRDDARGLQFEDGDGEHPESHVATAVEIYTFDADGPHLGQFVRDVRIDVFLTECRLAFACPRYEKGGGWRGDPVSMIVLNTGSKLLAAAKRHGKCLVGQVRYPWVAGVGWRSKAKTFSTLEELRVTVRDGTPRSNTLTAVDLLLPRGVRALDVAEDLMQRVVAHRLRDSTLADDARAALQRLADQGLSTENEGTKFTMAPVPGFRLVGALPQTPERPHQAPAPPKAPAAPPPYAPPPPVTVPAPATAPARLRSSEEAAQVISRSTEFFPRFGVLQPSSPKASVLDALGLRYDPGSWFPFPATGERVLDRLVAKVTARVGVDTELAPARGMAGTRLVPVFRGWSTLLLTDRRLVGLCVRGESLAGPVEAKGGTVVGWSMPLTQATDAVVTEGSSGALVRVASTVAAVGAVAISDIRRPRSDGAYDDVSPDELAARVVDAAGPVVAPAPPAPPAPARAPADEGESGVDKRLLREALGALQPTCEYVTYLAKGQRSPVLGIGVDGFGRLDLDGPPPHGRFLTMGTLWVTTTTAGRAPAITDLGGSTTMRFGPILEGGMELAVYDDHVIGLCTTGATLAGKVGEDRRMPALIFRLDLLLVEEVSLSVRPALLTGTKETSFSLVRSDFPTIALKAETIGRIEDVPTWDGRANGSKAAKGEAGRQIAIAAASLRLRGHAPNREVLLSVIAGDWRQDDGELVADLAPDEVDPDATVPPASREPRPAALPPPPRARPAPPAPPPAFDAYQTRQRPAVAVPPAAPLVPPVADRRPPTEPARRPVRDAPPPVATAPTKRPRPGAVVRIITAIVVVAAVLAAGLLIGVQTSDREMASARLSSSGPLPTISAGGPAAGGTATRTGTGAAPATPKDPQELARQISAAEQTILDPSQSTSQLRDAARSQQLLLRRLDLDPALADRVVPLIDAAVRPSVDQYVRAGRSIKSLIDAQSSYPGWEIVAPLPATELKGYFRDGEAASGVRWQYLAAIAAVETQMGRIKADSSEGAQGPMQFLPSTWERYGNGGNIRSFRDSVMAAGRLLKANGAPNDMRGALYRYNPSESYVQMVDRLAQRMIGNERQYLAIYEWQVLYKHVTGLALLPEGWPSVPATIVGPAES